MVPAGPNADVISNKQFACCVVKKSAGKAADAPIIPILSVGDGGGFLSQRSSIQLLFMCLGNNALASRAHFQIIIVEFVP